MTESPPIRLLAPDIVWGGTDLLVFEGFDPSKDEILYRPLGGGIEHGERRAEALGREFREELTVDLINVRYLDAVENLFTDRAQPGHEIVLLYRADLASPHLYGLEEFVVREEDSDLKGCWRAEHAPSIPLASCRW